MEHLETFDAACELLGYNAKEILPVVDKMPEALAKATVAATKLFIFSEAAWKAEDKKIDWNNYEQRKYYPWFDMETYPDNQVGSGAGFLWRLRLRLLAFACRLPPRFSKQRNFRVYGQNTFAAIQGINGNRVKN
ncbi:hypothetical protein [Pedobacter sp.]|uniref:hypothetical protein n=1 Tax=Pedobacter sp. TaxID=1411316 RepID=UPI00396CC5D9